MQNYLKISVSRMTFNMTQPHVNCDYKTFLLRIRVYSFCVSGLIIIIWQTEELFGHLQRRFRVCRILFSSRSGSESTNSLPVKIINNSKNKYKIDTFDFIINTGSNF